ncbi:unnamed protein product [Cuscuta epithymum]|uniref:Uncharacterized protein n=1 Tax=Cuscuta epithymum TaxID=186058 RepID=A0AAV0FIU8_9ASTE|nr:unnamed protein product [Cuscuta epithymum]
MAQNSTEDDGLLIIPDSEDELADDVCETPTEVAREIIEDVIVPDSEEGLLPEDGVAWDSVDPVSELHPRCMAQNSPEEDDLLIIPDSEDELAKDVIEKPTEVMGETVDPNLLKRRRDNDMHPIRRSPRLEEFLKLMIPKWETRMWDVDTD